MLSDRNPIDVIKERFQQFKDTVPQLKNEAQIPLDQFPEDYFTEKKKFCKQLYLDTKKFFDDHQDDISSTDKMLVLREYIRVWANTNCILDISDTEYAEVYKNSSLPVYNEFTPMMAGFNLKNIRFGNRTVTWHEFPFVDLRGADFTNVRLNHNKFYHCLFTDSTIGNAKFNGSKFFYCQLNKVFSSRIALQDVTIIESQKYNYPFFLKHLKVKPKALTPEKVAHALWLSDRNHQTTETYKSQFILWARLHSLKFDEKDVEKCLSRFEMK